MSDEEHWLLPFHQRSAATDFNPCGLCCWYRGNAFFILSRERVSFKSASSRGSISFAVLLRSARTVASFLAHSLFVRLHLVLVLVASETVLDVKEPNDLLQSKPNCGYSANNAVIIILYGGGLILQPFFHQHWSISSPSGMRPHCSSRWPSLEKLCLLTLLVSSYPASTMASYPHFPDAQSCSQFLGFPLSHQACQAAVDSLPRGTLPSIFTTREHTGTNNYIQVPVRYPGIDSTPSCVVTVDLDGHSLRDQFVFVPWDEIREMAQRVVNLCVDSTHRGGFITYGIPRTLESLIRPTAYGGDNTEIPAPAWVRQPDGTVDVVAIPSVSATYGYSRFCHTALHTLLLSRSTRVNPISDVPNYMTITVSGPLRTLKPESTDFVISMEVMEA